MNTEEKMNEVAAVFKAASGTRSFMHSRREYHIPVDYFIDLNNGNYIFIGNSGGGKFAELVDKYYELYNLQTVKETKRIALEKLREIAGRDNILAQEKGFLPYEVLSVELKISGRYLGWYYTMLKIGESIIPHVNTCLYYGILQQNIEKWTDDKYFVAEGLQEANIDYVFHGVGFSTKSGIYKATY